jgi:hypothetical protein
MYGSGVAPPTCAQEPRTFKKLIAEGSLMACEMIKLPPIDGYRILLFLGLSVENQSFLAVMERKAILL